MRDMLRDPWWKRIISGDTTAIPDEWVSNDGSLKLAGKEAEEFINILEEQGVELTAEMEKACKEYTIRKTISETGRHPYGMNSNEWEEIYGKSS